MSYYVAQKFQMPHPPLQFRQGEVLSDDWVENIPQLEGPIKANWLKPSDKEVTRPYIAVE